MTLVRSERTHIGTLACGQEADSVAVFLRFSGPSWPSPRPFAGSFASVGLFVVLFMLVGTLCVLGGRAMHCTCAVVHRRSCRESSAVAPLYKRVKKRPDMIHLMMPDPERASDSVAE